MELTEFDMNAYKLHVIKTDRFKTVTVGVAFLREIKREEITIRNLLKELMINATENYPSERQLVIETENLYDLKLISQNTRIGEDSILSFKVRFLHEDFTEKGMNKESIRFLMDVLFRPKLDYEIDKCKEKIRKSIISLSDNKVKYAINRLLEHTGNYPYSYNNYGFLEDLDKIDLNAIREYYDSVIKNDIVDVYVCGNVDPVEIKNIFRECFKIDIYHKDKVKVIADCLLPVKRIHSYKEKALVNQVQLDILYTIPNLTDYERKYVLPVFGEMLGGSANSILFDKVREENSYAYYVNAIVKPYDNLMVIYSGIANGNDAIVYKLINKELKKIMHGKFEDIKFESAKKTLASAIMISEDSPMGIINNYYAMRLVNSLSTEERIKKVLAVTKEDIVNLGKKIKVHSKFILEADDGKDNNKED